MNNLEKASMVVGGTVLAVSLLAGCPNPNPKPDYTAEKAAITNGANRLAQLQNANGSWAWDVTNASGPTTETHLNIAGVTAEGFLAADNANNDSQYLSNAEKTGDYLIAQYGSDGSKATILQPGSSTNINAFNVKFLYDLGKASGKSSYTTLANDLMTRVISAYPHPVDLVNADAAARGTGNGQGIVAWDLYNYIADAKSAGNPTWANNLTSQAETGTLPPSNDLTYIVGLSGFVMAGDTNAIAPLKAAQQSDGTWNDPNGAVQDTAYAVKALISANDMADAYKGVQAGMKNQATTGVNAGGWVDNSTGGGNAEISEVDAEVVEAITDYIIANP
jgi:outer membrane murein-binding lipoprotein Lpp